MRLRVNVLLAGKQKMMTNPEQMDPRRLARYKATALRLEISLVDYLHQGALGKRYCVGCKRWKGRRSFQEYSSTKSSFAGKCKACLGVKRRPAKLEGRFWGPAVRAAKVIGCTPEEYIAKRRQQQRWCTTHKGWFDASTTLNSPRYTGGTIIRCRPCHVALKERKQ